MLPTSVFSSFFFFNDTATTEIYTLSLHDALPISRRARRHRHRPGRLAVFARLWSPADLLPSRRDHRDRRGRVGQHFILRSEEHTSELQSQSNLVCRLLLEKKKKKTNTITELQNNC